MFASNQQGKVWKWILIIVLVLIVLSCAAGYFGMQYLKSHGKEMATGLLTKTLKTQIEKNLPAGYDRGKVEEAFQGLEQGVKDGRVKPEALGPIGSEIGNAMQDGKLTSEELDKILEDVKRISSPPTT